MHAANLLTVKDQIKLRNPGGERYILGLSSGNSTTTLHTVSLYTKQLWICRLFYPLRQTPAAVPAGPLQPTRPQNRAMIGGAALAPELQVCESHINLLIALFRVHVSPRQLWLPGRIRFRRQEQTI